MIDLNWYYTLNHPPLTPPSWVFAPAWTILYFLIFISLILFAFKKSLKPKTWGYVLFFSQLILNLFWTPVFFVMHNMGFALALIILLDILVILNIKEFFEISKPAAYCLIPYLLWIIFATYLNIGIFVMN